MVKIVEQILGIVCLVILGAFLILIIQGVYGVFKEDSSNETKARLEGMENKSIFGIKVLTSPSDVALYTVVISLIVGGLYTILKSLEPNQY